MADDGKYVQLLSDLAEAVRLLACRTKEGEGDKSIVRAEEICQKVKAYLSNGGGNPDELHGQLVAPAGTGIRDGVEER